MAQPRIVLDGVDDEVNQTLATLVAELDAKRTRNLLRAAYYDGKHAVEKVGTIIPPQYYRLGIVLGWSAKAVDILARRCNLDDTVWPDGDLGSLGFAELADANQLVSEVSAAAVSSLIHGPAFLVTTKGGQDEPPALLHVKDALNATGQWDNRRRRLRNLLSITGRDDRSNPLSLALYLDGRTITAQRGERARRWTVVDDQDHPWGVPVEVMAYKPRPARPFGSSRISRAVMSLHDQALRTVIRMEAHNDIYAIPDLWILGADEALFRNADGSTKASWQVLMGRLKGLPDRDGDDARDDALDRVDVKQFPASSPTPHLLSLKQQAQLFAGETSVPLTSLGVSDTSNPTSADSYIASREDLIAEAEGTTDDWTAPVGRSVRRLLAIANGIDAQPREWASIAPQWRNPIYLSRAAAADAGSKQLSAAPWLAETEVGLQLLGLTKQQIDLAMADRRRASGRQVLEALVAGNADAQP